MRCSIAALCLATSLAACASAPPLAETEDPTPPGHIQGHAILRRADAPKLPRVLLFDLEAGTHQEQRVADDLAFDFAGLEAGSYRLTIQEPLSTRNTWAFDHRELHLGTAHGITVEPTREELETCQPASLRIVQEPHTPPLILLLADADMPSPSMSQLGELFEGQAFAEHILYSYAGDGHSPIDVPPLPPGDWQVMTIANDWEPGDPQVALRSWPIKLEPGSKNTLILRERLQEITLR